MALVKAAIYARYSSDNQRDESIDAQVRACEEHAQRNGMQIVKIYIDRAKSATSDKRPEFQRMIEESSTEAFSTLIIHKLDRFSRDKYDSAKYKRKLKQNGVRLISVTENLDGSPESIILESVIEGMAEYYSKNLAREVMKGLTENALKCQHTGGIPPLGFDVDRVTKKYIINEREAETVRKIFDLYLAGYGYKPIIDQLNEGQHVTKLGNPFGKNSIHDLLKNEKYCGVYTFNRSTSKNYDGKRNNHMSKVDEDVIRIPGGVPAIVSQEVFDKVQEKMNKNKHQPGAYKAKETYLLSGLIVCGECLKREGKTHSMMGNVKHSGRAKTKHVTYRCANRDRTKQCDNKELRREYIENYVLTQLEKNIFSEKAIPFLVKKLNDYQDTVCSDQAKEITRLNDTLKELNGQINNIVDAITNGFAHSSLVEKLTVLEQQKAAIEITIMERNRKQPKDIVTEDMVRSLFTMFRQFVAEKNILEVKKFISNYIEKVIIYRDHVEVVFFFSWGDICKAEAYHFSSVVTRSKLLAG
ncbi:MULTISPECIES: recombinase family protein [Pelosinus]|uniref:Resolvase domain-containing protein n=1 Tax=Pelosinus fermentans B4 TaxID=1149862 RepID=I9B376_9FIRM|nr:MULTISPECIES: recombinase family protein [Pelosinus]EIW19597.1 Resolvase domain-containing protein [Pelosinus fermentans B4]EIW24669.1 Recombinase [Pelosinus fermentans A11]OAM96050.1 Resolvase domain-containing protein [Pelosinus fermentans DSM 17108]SDR35800.1 site-specific DNA recombinase [Pelosinus fermentans]